MKKLIFRNIFKDITYFFLITSLSLTLIVWVIQAVNYLDFVSEDGHSFKVYFMYSLLSLPKIFNKLILFVFFISVFFTISKYEENNEILIFWTHGIKKSEFIVKVNKGKDWYSFERLDPYPQIWTRGGINLFRNKEHKELFQVEEKDSMFLETQSYNVSKLTYDETDKSLTNSTFHYAGKKNKELKIDALQKLNN